MKSLVQKNEKLRQDNKILKLLLKACLPAVCFMKQVSVKANRQDDIRMVTDLINSIESTLNNVR